MSVLAVEKLAPYSRLQLTFGMLALGLGLALFLGLALLAAGWIAAAALGVVAVAVWLIASPRQGFYAVVAAVLIVEGGHEIDVLESLNFMNRGIDDLIGVGPPLSLLDSASILLVVGVVRQAMLTGTKLRFGEFFWPLALLELALLLGWARGVQTGGDFTIAFHELRALLFLPVIYFLAINLITEKRHLKYLLVVLLISVLMISWGAISTHLSLVRPNKTTESLDIVFANHEDALFAAIVVVMALATLVWGRGMGQRTLMALVGVIVLTALLVMKRRLGLLALDAGLIMVTLLLIKYNLRLAMVLMPIVIVLGVLYLGVYWDSTTGGVGQGARAFRSVIGSEQSSEDESSDDYRDIEARNVETNIRWNPLWGTGFGHEYQFPEPLPDLTDFWAFQKVIPHNTVLWTWMKGGALTFVMTMALFGYGIVRGMQVAKREMDPMLKSWAIAAAAAVPMVFMFAWGDLGLTVGRTMIIFGLFLGVITVVGRLTEGETAKADEAAPVRTRRPRAAEAAQPAGAGAR